MRFILANSNGTDDCKDEILAEHPGLDKFNIVDEEYSYVLTRKVFDEDLQPIKQEVEKKKNRIVIEINSLEELVSLTEATNNSIIIHKYDEDFVISSVAGELEIEIYDGYRE